MNLLSVSETQRTTCSPPQNIYKLSVEVIRRGESKRKSAHGSTSSVRCVKSSGSGFYMCFCFFKLIFRVLLSVKNTQRTSPSFKSSLVISFNCCWAVGEEIRLHVSPLMDSSLRDVLNVGAENVSFLITSTADVYWRCFKSYHKVLEEAALELFNHIPPYLLDLCDVKNELSVSTFIPTRTRSP